MTRQEFLNTLQSRLAARHIPDAAGIAAEYDEHFERKLADGFSEEEIAARLGDPAALAAEFAQDAPDFAGPGQVFTAVLAVFSWMVFAPLLLLMFAWAFVMGAFALSCFVAAGLLLLGGNIAGLLPAMPYFPAFLFGIGLAGLGGLSGIGAFFFLRYTLWTGRTFTYWLRRAAGRERNLPPAFPKASPRNARKLRTVCFVFLSLLFMLVAGYIAAALWAGSLEFWHVWGWFAP